MSVRSEAEGDMQAAGLGLGRGRRGDRTGIVLPVRWGCGRRRL